MPEGPEIRRAADKIAAVLENEVIEELFLGLERLKKFRRILMGTRVSVSYTHLTLPTKA